MPPAPGAGLTNRTAFWRSSIPLDSHQGDDSIVRDPDRCQRPIDERSALSRTGREEIADGLRSDCIPTAVRLQKDRTFDFNPGIWIEFMQIKTFCNFVGTRPNIHWSHDVTARRLGQWDSPAASGNVYIPDAALREVNSMWFYAGCVSPLDAR